MCKVNHFQFQFLCCRWVRHFSLKPLCLSRELVDCHLPSKILLLEVLCLQKQRTTKGEKRERERTKHKGKRTKGRKLSWLLLHQKKGVKIKRKKGVKIKRKKEAHQLWLYFWVVESHSHHTLQQCLVDHQPWLCDKKEMILLFAFQESTQFSSQVVFGQILLLNSFLIPCWSRTQCLHKKLASCHSYETQPPKVRANLLLWQKMNSSSALKCQSRPLDPQNHKQQYDQGEKTTIWSGRKNNNMIREKKQQNKKERNQNKKLDSGAVGVGEWSQFETEELTLSFLVFPAKSVTMQSQSTFGNMVIWVLLLWCRKYVCMSTTPPLTHEMVSHSSIDAVTTKFLWFWQMSIIGGVQSVVDTRHRIQTNKSKKKKVKRKEKRRRTKARRTSLKKTSLRTNNDVWGQCCVWLLFRNIFHQNMTTEPTFFSPILFNNKAQVEIKFVFLFHLHWHIVAINPQTFQFFRDQNVDYDGVPSFGGSSVVITWICQKLHHFWWFKICVICILSLFILRRRRGGVGVGIDFTNQNWRGVCEKFTLMTNYVMTRRNCAIQKSIHAWICHLDFPNTCFLEWAEIRCLVQTSYPDIINCFCGVEGDVDLVIQLSNTSGLAFDKRRCCELWWFGVFGTKKQKTKTNYKSWERKLSTNKKQTFGWVLMCLISLPTKTEHEGSIRALVVLLPISNVTSHVTLYSPTTPSTRQKK